MAPERAPAGGGSAWSNSIRQRRERQYLLVLAPEDLDGETAPTFVARIAAVEDNTDIVIDLRRLFYCGAEVIGVLLELDRHARTHNCTLTLSAPPPEFDLLVRACDLEGHFTVRRSGAVRRRLAGTDPAQR